MNDAARQPPPQDRSINAWIWTTIGTSILICSALTALHLTQERALVHSTEIIRDFRQARIDLYEGVLHMSLSDAPDSPWQREQGLALLTQALTAFERTLDQLPKHTESADRFAAQLHALDPLLPEEDGQHTSDARQEVELRAAVHQLDATARRVDAEARKRLLAIHAQQQRVFLITLSVSAALLGLICIGMIRFGRRQAAAEAARAEAMRQAQAGYERFEKIFDASPAATCIVTLDEGRILAVNDAFCRLFGYPREDVLGKTESDIGIWAEPSERASLAQRLKTEKRVAEHELKFRMRNGETRDGLLSAELIECLEQACHLEILNDITERKRYENRIEYLATHDGLTGLPNRNLIHDRTTQAIGYARRGDTQFALMHLGLDRFKVINDGFGHPFGNDLLRAVGARLAGTVHEGDTVARQGSDEFLLLLSNLSKPADAYIAVERLQKAFERPFHLDGREIYVTASIGVSLYPQDGAEADILIRNAGVAMFRAKNLGRNTCQFFTSRMSEESRQLVELETQLRLALQHNQLHLVYQPKVSLANGRITGCEALLRWDHPTLGAVSPARFIPIAEESGLIVPIGNWVLRTACAQNKAWQQAGLPAFPVSVNLSARQFMQQDVVAWVLNVLEETGLAPGMLELELTESLIAQDIEKAIDTVSRLKAAGVRLSIDDFGTGYSSLSHLKRFHVDTLKIDQSFVRNMLTEPDDATIVLAVKSLAHNLRMSAVAEGVETVEQCRFLRQNHCDEIQGYLFSKPVAAHEFEALLQSGQLLPFE